MAGSPVAPQSTAVAPQRQAAASPGPSSGSPMGLRARVQRAEQALEASQLDLRLRKQQLSDVEHEQRVALDQSQQAESRQVYDPREGQALRHGRRGAELRLRQATTSWLDPKEMQKRIDEARSAQVNGVAIREAESSLQGRQQRLQDAYDRVSAALPQGSHRREEHALRQARAAAMQEELTALMQRHFSNVTTSNDEVATSEHQATTLLQLQRMLSVVQQAASVDRKLVTEARELVQTSVQPAIEQALSTKGSLASIANLREAVELGNEMDVNEHPQLASLMQLARSTALQQQVERLELARIFLSTTLQEGTRTSSVSQELAALEHAIDVAESAVDELDYEELSVTSANRESIRHEREIIEQLVSAAATRVNLWQTELASSEREREQAANTALVKRRLLLESVVAAAAATVDANQDRLKLAQEFAQAKEDMGNAERARQTASARQVAAQEQASREQAEQLQQAQRESDALKDEIKRLKNSMKLQQDGHHLALRKAKDELKSANAKVEEEAKHAKQEVLEQKRLLERTRVKMRDANEKQHTNFVQSEQEQKKKYQKLKEQLDQQTQLATFAQQELERLQAEQHKLVAPWQKAEKDAMALADKNLEMANKNMAMMHDAIAAQRKAEEETHKAQRELKEMRDEFFKVEDAQRLEKKEQEQILRMNEKRMEIAQEEAGSVKSREAQMLQELKEHRENSKKAIEEAAEIRAEMEKMVAENKADREQQAALLQEQTARADAAEAAEEGARQGVVKLKISRDHAFEERKKAKAQSLKFKQEHTEALEGKSQAEADTRNAIAEKDKLAQELNEAKEEVRKLEANAQKVAKREHEKVKQEFHSIIEKHEKRLEQKTNQLEYAEDQLQRMEAAEKERKAKGAKDRNRDDELLKASTDKLKALQQEADGLRKELEEATKKGREAVSNLQLALKRLKGELQAAVAAQKAGEAETLAAQAMVGTLQKELRDYEEGKQSTQRSSRKGSPSVPERGRAMSTTPDGGSSAARQSASPPRADHGSPARRSMASPSSSINVDHLARAIANEISSTMAATGSLWPPTSGGTAPSPGTGVSSSQSSHGEATTFQELMLQRYRDGNQQQVLGQQLAFEDDPLAPQPAHRASAQGREATDRVRREQARGALTPSISRPRLDTSTPTSSANRPRSDRPRSRPAPSSPAVQGSPPDLSAFKRSRPRNLNLDAIASGPQSRESQISSRTEQSSSRSLTKRSSQNSSRRERSTGPSRGAVSRAAAPAPASASDAFRPSTVSGSLPSLPEESPSAETTSKSKGSTQPSSSTPTSQQQKSRDSSRTGPKRPSPELYAAPSLPSSTEQAGWMSRLFGQQHAAHTEHG